MLVASYPPYGQHPAYCLSFCYLFTEPSHTSNVSSSFLQLSAFGFVPHLLLGIGKIKVSQEEWLPVMHPIGHEEVNYIQSRLSSKSITSINEEQKFSSQICRLKRVKPLVLHKLDRIFNPIKYSPISLSYSYKGIER